MKWPFTGPSRDSSRSTSATIELVTASLSGNAASVEQPDTVTRLASSRIGRDTDGGAKIGRI